MAQNGVSSKASLPVLIIGAGVSGLTLGQGLRLNNIPFRIFERHPRSYASQGHRFRISPEAVDALNSVLSDRLRDLMNCTRADSTAIIPRYVDATTFEFPPRTPNPPPHSMPVDRAWIRHLLTLGLEDAIEYEKTFASYKAHDSGVTVSFTDGSSAPGSLLVGADGIKGGVRKQLQPQRRLLDLERQITWGRTPLTAKLREELPVDVLTWFMAIEEEKNVQAVFDSMTWSRSVHQVSDEELPNLEDYIYWAITSAEPQVYPKTSGQKKAFLNGLTKHWHPSLRKLLDHAAYDRSTCLPVLSSKPDIEILSKLEPRVTLIGDAAHPMSPMGGAGGSTAIRNAVDLALTISNGLSLESIKEFEERMTILAKEKIEHSYRGGQKFWKGKKWYGYLETDA